MKVMGISFFGGGLHYAILEKTGDEFHFIERTKCTNPSPERIRESSDWIYDTLDEMCGRHDISKIGFKLHYDLSNIKDLYSHGAPVGVLGYFCSEKNIRLEGYTVKKINGYKFLSLPKGTKTLNWLDSNHKDGNKYWDNNARYSVAIALHRAMEKA